VPSHPVVQAAVAFGALVLAALVVDLSLQYVRFGADALSELAYWLWRDYFRRHGRYPGLQAGTLLLEGIAVMLIVAEAASSAVQRRRIVGALACGVAGAALLSVVDIAEAAWRTAHPLQALMALTSTIRFSAATADVNAAGSAFVAVLPIPLALWWRGGRGARLWLIPAMIIAAGLWLSGSRVAFLAGALSVAINGLVALRGVGRRTGAAIAIGAVILIVAVLAQPLRSNQVSASSATSVRAGLAVAAFRMIAENPVTGIGLGEFYRRSGEYASPALLELFPPAIHENAHNNYLQIAAELGILGLAAFMWVLATAFVNYRSQQQAADIVDIALAGGSIAFLLTCLGGHPLLSPEIAFVCWLMIGCLSLIDGSPSPAPYRRAARRIALVLVVAAAVSLPVRLLAARRAVDLEHVGIGVSAWQTAEDGTRFRWADSSATVFVPGNAAGFKLRLAADTPEPIPVELRLDGRIADTVMVGAHGWREVSVVLPRRSSGAAFRRLELRALTDGGAPAKLRIGKVEPVGR
jgi:hypothetical protein